MSKSPPILSDLDREALLAHVADHVVTARTAIALMVMNGDDRAEAARQVFHALGGSDATELDAFGRPRYAGSGKLVADVQRLIAEAEEP